MSALDQRRVDLPDPGPDAFEELESRVRSYCRRWPVTFDGASGSWIYDETGRSYLDIFSGAGSLNYGHNDPVQKRALLDYLASDRIVQSLDMFTAAKRDFLVTFDELVLRPRGLSYRDAVPRARRCECGRGRPEARPEVYGKDRCRLLRRRLPRRHARRALYDGAPLLSRGGGRPAGPLGATPVQHVPPRRLG